MSIFLQVDSLAVANQVLSEDAQPVEQTLSIWSLLTSGGAGGIAIMIVLFLLLFMALFLYFERIMAINKARSVAPRSNKRMKNFGTILKFLNMIFSPYTNPPPTTNLHSKRCQQFTNLLKNIYNHS